MAGRKLGSNEGKDTTHYSGPRKNICQKDEKGMESLTELLQL